MVQGAVRWNRSMPGEVISQSQFVAVSRGRQGQRYLVFRAGTGREAYQALAPGEVLVDFPSRDVSATWKQWLGEDWGFNTSGDTTGAASINALEQVLESSSFSSLDLSKGDRRLGAIDSAPAPRIPRHDHYSGIAPFKRCRSSRGI
jgi:hypothetical protein